MREIYLLRNIYHSPVASANTLPGPGGRTGVRAGLPPSIPENKNSEPNPPSVGRSIGVSIYL